MLPLTKLSGLFLVFFFFFFFHQFQSQQTEPKPLWAYCYRTGNYAKNSSYETNLDYVLSVLRYQSFYTGFYNYNFGSFADAVSGLFLCRGDISLPDCYNCVVSASQTLVRNCTNQKEAIVWYDQCMVRYSNSRFTSVNEETPSVTWNSFDALRYESYLWSTVNDKMNELIGDITTGSYAFYQGSIPRVSFLGEIYDLDCLVQCTPDLTGSVCNQCLKTALSNLKNCCYGAQWALAYTPNCFMRYETVALPPPPPPPSPPPPPLSGSSGYGDSGSGSSGYGDSGSGSSGYDNSGSGPSGSDDSVSFKFNGR